MVRAQVILILNLLLGMTGTPATRSAALITVDTSDVPELRDYAARVQGVADEWYPRLVADLPSDGFIAPTKITIVFRHDYDGVAATSGERIVASADYFTKHPDDLGAFVHELAHVAQHYTRGDRPGWLVEGIADYLRFYRYEPAARRPHLNPQRARYDDSYQTSAAFLDWAQRTFDANLVIELNAACREGRYDESLWQRRTGRTLQQLGDEWHASLAR